MSEVEEVELVGKKSRREKGPGGLLEEERSQSR